MIAEDQYYTEFMRWFKDNYPQLHGKYYNNITMLRNHHGVSLRGDDIPAQDFDQIKQIQYEYSSPPQ